MSLLQGPIKVERPNEVKVCSVLRHICKYLLHTSAVVPQNLGSKVMSLVQSTHVCLTRVVMFDDLAQIQQPGEQFKGKRMNFLLQISLWLR